MLLEEILGSPLSNFLFKPYKTLKITKLKTIKFIKSGINPTHNLDMRIFLSWYAVITKEKNTKNIGVLIRIVTKELVESLYIKIHPTRIIVVNRMVNKKLYPNHLFTFLRLLLLPITHIIDKINNGIVKIGRDTRRKVDNES